MGWMTESAFIPKESKKIELESHSTLVNLKAKLLEERARLSTRAINQPPAIVKNPGVEARALKDAESKRIFTPVEVEAKLREKAEKYDEIMKGGKMLARDGSQKYMVDFE